MSIIYCISTSPYYATMIKSLQNAPDIVNYVSGFPGVVRDCDICYLQESDNQFWQITPHHLCLKSCSEGMVNWSSFCIKRRGLDIGVLISLQSVEDSVWETMLYKPLWACTTNKNSPTNRAMWAKHGNFWLPLDRYLTVFYVEGLLWCKDNLHLMAIMSYTWNHQTARILNSFWTSIFQRTGIFPCLWISWW